MSLGPITLIEARLAILMRLFVSTYRRFQATSFPAGSAWMRREEGQAYLLSQAALSVRSPLPTPLASLLVFRFSLTAATPSTDVGQLDLTQQTQTGSTYWPGTTEITRQRPGFLLSEFGD